MLSASLFPQRKSVPEDMLKIFGGEWLHATSINLSLLRQNQPAEPVSKISNGEREEWVRRALQIRNGQLVAAHPARAGNPLVTILNSILIKRNPVGLL
jgi:hypothetical protein